MAENLRTVRKRVGRHISQLRRRRGWSQDKLAERVGNSPKHIGQVERGEINVGIDILFAIGAALEVSVSELFRTAAGNRSGSETTIIDKRDLEGIESAYETLHRILQGHRRRV